jgi:hypothetical protein
MRRLMDLQSKVVAETRNIGNAGRGGVAPPLRASMNPQGLSEQWPQGSCKWWQTQRQSDDPVHVGQVWRGIETYLKRNTLGRDGRVHHDDELPWRQLAPAVTV